MTVGRVDNLRKLAEEILRRQAVHFSEMKGNEFNQTEVIATLINQQDSLVDGLRYVHERVTGPARCCCSPTTASTHRGTGWGARRS